MHHLKISVFKKRRQNMFLYTGVISRSGYLLIGIAFFLTLISFTKGIQILMFIPAFVLAIFLYSLYELYKIKKHIQLKFHSDKKGTYLKIYIQKGLKHNFLLGNIGESGNISFMEPTKEGGYKLDSSKNYKLVLYAFGSFDIFRHLQHVGEIKFSPETQEPSFKISEKYTSGKQIQKLDNLRSSMSEIPYIRETYGSNVSKSQSDFTLESNDTISKVSRKNLGKYHIIMILLGIIGIAIEWNELLLNILMAVTVIGVFLLRKQQGKIDEKYKNIALIGAFIFMIVLSRIQSDMTGPGSVFLIQILSIIYLFPKDFRNSFLYIFLTLFVFVAISLFSNQIWFIMLFTIYLCISIYLLFFISGNESFDDKEYKIGNKLSFRSFLWAYSSIIVLMGVLFVLLPHGNASESRTFFGNSDNEGFVSGFNEEISLENIQNIKEDRRKIIVVEDVDSDDVTRLGLEYFRGKRYNYFDGVRWDDTFPNDRYSHEDSNEDTTTSLNIKYYLNGSRYLYLPASPVSIAGTQLQFGNFHNDDTTLRTFFGVNEPLSLDIEFVISPEGKIIDRPFERLEVDNTVNIGVSEIFTQYLNSIPENIRSSPQALSDYVKNRSGFTYSTTDIAENMSDFLYGKKSGHCEYYATVLTIVLQEFGFEPSFVSGFGYGEYNSLAGSYVVRASNAHTWVELYDEQSGKWEILDPTPGESFSARQFLDSGFERIIELYDFIDIKWYTYIVNYTGDEQKKLYSYLWSKIVYIIALVGVAGITVIIFTYLQHIRNFLALTKKEKILALLVWKFKEEKNIYSQLSRYDQNLAYKFQKFLYADKGNLYFADIYKILKIRKK